MSYTLVLEWMPGDLYMSAVTARCTAPTSSYSVVWLPPNKVYQITLYCGSTSLVSFLVGAFRGKAWSYMKRYCIITIEREYASGGSQVGKLVGQALGIPVYGREILEIAAREGGTTPEYIEHLEETDTNSLLYSLLMMAKTAVGQPAQISGNDALNLLEARIIEEMARRGRCVIVGRCAGWILRDRRDVLNVFIHADEETRIKRAVEVYGVPEGQAAATLRQFEPIFTMQIQTLLGRKKMGIIWYWTAVSWGSAPAQT